MIEETGSPRGSDALSVSVAGDRVAAEALALEFRRLARRLGVEIQSMRVEPGALPAPLPPESDPA
jgi:hypothetical protein